MTRDSKTRDLIATLAKDTERDPSLSVARRRGLAFPAFARFWTLGAALILALSIRLLPIRSDLGDRLGAIDMGFLIVLWSAATVLPALKVYALAFPDAALTGRMRSAARLAPLPFVLLGIYTAVHLRFADLGYQFFRESSYLNGGCGMVIAVAGALHASVLFSWIRRGATAAPMKVGAWAAASTASFASFIVQFACANENPIHVALWHFVPMLALVGAAALFAKRALRW